MHMFVDGSFLKMLDDMIDFQRQKVLKLSREIIPHLTPEDIRNPQDFPELERDTLFNYEDGILNGYLAVRSSYQTLFKE